MIGKAKRFVLGNTVPVIKLTGVVDQNMTSKLQYALSQVDADRAQALAIVFNTPGGSAVQSELMINKVTYFCKENKLPLYTFAEDMCASAGYWLIVMGDQVYAESSTMIGSIGVLMSKLNAKGFLEDKQVEIRNFTTNEDSFMHRVHPSKELDDKLIEDTKAIGSKLHKGFITHVEKYRGDKFTVEPSKRDEVLFNADVWIARKALELGLIDGVGLHQEILARDFPKAKIQYVEYESVIKNMLNNFNLMKFSAQKGRDISLNSKPFDNSL